MSSGGALPAGDVRVVSVLDVFAAADRIHGAVHETPVLRSSAIDALASAAAGFPVEAFFKCELFQKTGSFKARGACNAVLSLDEAAAAAGVVTHSSGNHAQALAYAARRRGIPAHIVMPSNSPAVKKAAVRGYGAAVSECAPTQTAREAAAAAIGAATGAHFVHPSEDPLVIAGQGTLALELYAQAAAAGAEGQERGERIVPRTEQGRAAAAAYPAAAARLGYSAAADASAAGGGAEAGVPSDASPPPPLDVVIVPVGGGGMIGGVATALAALDPRVRVVGAEPAGADDAARSKAAGVRLGHAPGGPSTIADGLRTTLGPATWPLVRDLVSAVRTVPDTATAAALRVVYERLKLAIEPSAAVSVALLLSGGAVGAPLPPPPAGRPLRVGVVLCGGNIDLADLAAVLALAAEEGGE